MKRVFRELSLVGKHIKDVSVVLYRVIQVILIVAVVSVSFSLLNMQSTIANILGLLLFIADAAYIVSMIKGFFK